MRIKLSVVVGRVSLVSVGVRILSLNFVPSLEQNVVQLKYNYETNVH